ncbi:MAG: replicative DNA helicase [Streptococcaceae bacterium]|jgi:replicative DNA helicase|nr:replicative DNA helicase [Streptococcaceae bacterium]
MPENESSILHTPPQDLPAEQAVLGAVFLDNDVLIDVQEFVVESDFYRNAHKAIFRAMIALHERGEVIDVVTVRAQLELQGDLEMAGGVAYLAELVSGNFQASYASFYAEHVQEKSQLRQLIARFSETVERAYAQEDVSEDLLAQAERDMVAISQGKSRTGFSNVADLLEENYNTLNERAKNNSSVTGLATRYADLDALTTGFHADELIILAARPGVGKTAFALNVAANVAIHGNDGESVAVAIFSLEMGKESLVDRLIASTGPVNANHLRTGQMNENDWQHFTSAQGVLARTQIYVDDTPGIKVTEIRAKSRRLAQETGNLGLIIIDYLQLITGNGRENRQQEVSEISRQLKILAKELHVPVIALSQLSRGVESREDKRPRLSDLRESGSIEQDADIVAFLYQERPEASEEGDESFVMDNKVEVIIEKNRSGARGVAELIFMKESNKFMSYNHREEPQGF